MARDVTDARHAMPCQPNRIFLIGLLFNLLKSFSAKIVFTVAFSDTQWCVLCASCYIPIRLRKVTRERVRASSPRFHVDFFLSLAFISHMAWVLSSILIRISLIFDDSRKLLR